MKQMLDDLSDLYKAAGIPLVLVNQDGEEQAAFPYAFEGAYKTEFLQKMVRLVQEVRPAGVVLHATEDFYYLAVTYAGNGIYLVTAPVSNIADNPNTVSYAFTEWVTRERLTEFVHMVASLPGMNNFQLSKIAALAKRLCSGDTSDGTSIHQAETKEVGAMLPGDQLAVFSIEKKDSGKHMSYEFENCLFSAVEAGDEQQAMQVISRPLYGVIGRMSMNSLRQAKYLFACCAYACSRAAIRGGMLAENSFQLSDSFCQRMDGLSSVAAVDQLRIQMIFEYCRRVAQCQEKKSYRYTTRLCCDYIREHLYDEITIEDLTRLAHLNRRSLSAYFKEDTGKRIPEYINDARMDEAKYLLTQTEMPPAEISELLQFCNQSYFCRKFREKFGVSPNSLRNT